MGTAREGEREGRKGGRAARAGLRRPDRRACTFPKRRMTRTARRERTRGTGRPTGARPMREKQTMVRSSRLQPSLKKSWNLSRSRRHRRRRRLRGLRGVGPDGDGLAACARAHATDSTPRARDAARSRYGRRAPPRRLRQGQGQRRWWRGMSVGSRERGRGARVVGY